MKTLILLMLALSLNANAQLTTFNPNTPVNSSDFNNNFSYIKNFLKFKNITINFTPFNSQNLISHSAINTELAKIQEAGFSAYSLNSGFITSSPVNQIFSSLDQEINNYEPELSVMQNTIYNGSISSEDLNYPTSFSVTANPTKGILNFNVNGEFSYYPNLNILGTDNFSIKANDGELANKVVKFNVNIDGEGLIISSGARTYYDGTLASSCNDYKNQNNGKYKYSGATGNGIYKISILPSGSQDVYCDMITDGGGWTLFSRFDGDDTTGVHFGSTDFGTLNSTTLSYSLRTNKLGAVSKIMAKSPAGTKIWTMNSSQTISIPSSGGYQVALSDRGDDNCTGMAMHFNDEGCWGGRKAGPAVAVTTASYPPTCGGTGNWLSTTYFYGRAGSTSTLTCIPVGKWNQTHTQATYAPVQEWYIR